MDYAYKVTTHGLAVMAACMALEKPFHITRVAFGGGKVDEETNLADVHELLEYVSDGAVGERRHQDDRLEFTIQFANSEHPDVKTFLLSEFIVFAENPATGEETDLLYGSLGDYRQPVPAFNPAYPPSVFSFPLELILSDELQVNFPAPAGLVTYDDLASAVEDAVKNSPALRGAASAGMITIVVPASGWIQAEPPVENYAYICDVAVGGVTARQWPCGACGLAGSTAAQNAGVAHGCETMDGSIRFFAKRIPAADITATITLVTAGAVSSGGGSIAVDKLGGGLTVSNDGTVSLNLGNGLAFDESGKVQVDTVDEDAVHQEVVDILNGDAT